MPNICFWEFFTLAVTPRVSSSWFLQVLSCLDVCISGISSDATLLLYVFFKIIRFMWFYNIYSVYLCVLDASVSCLYVTELLSWSLKKKNVESVMELDTS